MSKLTGTLFLAAVTVLPLLAGPATADELSPAMRSAICGDRSGCSVLQHEAGTALDGGQRLVIEVRLAVADNQPNPPDDGCRNGGTLDGGSEFWIVNGGTPPQRLLALCNDGYGASGVGDDAVTVSDNRLDHAQTGGSAWRWERATAYRLEPPSAIETVECSYHTLAPGSGILTRLVHVTAEAQSLGFDSAMPANAGAVGCPEAIFDIGLARPADGVLAASVVTGFGTDADTRRFRTVPNGAALGDCSLSIATDGSRGFVVFGRPDEKETAEMRIVAESTSSLIVQVRDPLAAGSRFAASWVHQPHIELWRVPSSADRIGGRADPKTVEQIGIDLDGSAWPGINATTLPTVEHWTARDETGQDVVVMRIRWSDENALSQGIAAVYSQSERGRQARMVATTGVERNRPLLLPPVRRIGRDCDLRDGLWRLLPVPEIRADSQ